MPAVIWALQAFARAEAMRFAAAVVRMLLCVLLGALILLGSCGVVGAGMAVVVVQDPRVAVELGLRGPVGAIIVGPLPELAAGAVTDAQRFQLAMAVGWSLEQSVIATAISIAEDGSGNPAALSAANWDSSRDLGLWQINSGWWAQFGGQAALEIPINNAMAAHAIYLKQGWCAWSTYGTQQLCGVKGHNDAYRAYICRAEAASGGPGCR